MSKQEKTTIVKIATAAAGHEEHVVNYADAMELVREQMAKGKWLNIVTGSGKEQFFTDFGQMTQELGDGIQGIIEDAQEMQLNAGLQGGDEQSV
jgi:hypothetical protein